MVWEALPLHPNSKKPMMEWSKPTDPAEVDKILDDVPGVNIGVVLGQRSKGLACQDFEVEADYLEYYGEAHSGLESSTVVTTTPNGGIHVLAYSGNSFTKKVKICEDHPLDVLGEGCILVMPPSQIDGKRYRTIGSWRVELKPDDNLLTSTVERCRALGWKISNPAKQMPIRKIVPGVKQGLRNDSAFKYARHLLFNIKLDFETTLYELQRWNRQNRPPLPDREILTILNSATRYHPSSSDLWRRFG